MPGRRNAPEEKMYAWSNLYLGGESEETRLGRKIVSNRNIIEAGSEVSASDLSDLSEDEIQEWKDQGVLRPYPHPEGYEGDVALGQSPYTYVVEKAKAELESAEGDFDSESAEDRLIRASVVGTQVFGPNPEDVLMGNDLPEGVEEVPVEEATSSDSDK